MDDLLTPDDVNDICALLDGSGYDRLEVKTSRFLLRLAREGEGAAWTQDWSWSGDAGVPGQGTVVASPAPEAHANAIAAALPGTFYRASQPGVPPFVEEGDRVEPGTVVGIIETMKLMTPVHAVAAGRIARILAADGTSVNKGAALMLIEPVGGA